VNKLLLLLFLRHDMILKNEQYILYVWGIKKIASLCKN